ncbi:MAG TPA: hypothetical protein PLO60_11175, partial [Pseudomonadales bacterium]|nr:hypothetical protein [Pseudomonadales bacterium]
FARMSTITKTDHGSLPRQPVRSAPKGMRTSLPPTDSTVDAFHGSPRTVAERDGQATVIALPKRPNLLAQAVK